MRDILSAIHPQTVEPLGLSAAVGFTGGGENDLDVVNAGELEIKIAGLLGGNHRGKADRRR